MDKLEGGFVIHKAPALLRGLNAHTEGLAGRPISEADLAATNRIQRTPWAINPVVRWAAHQLKDLEGCPAVPTQEAVALPPRVEEDVWETMDLAAKKQHRMSLGKLHRENASRTGRRIGWGDALDTADLLADKPRFWFPWTHDFRLRRYPVACGGLSVQGTDLQKGLLRFARPKRLGETGLYWLAVHAANCWGYDKLHPDERVGWALDNAALFERIARNPENWREWTFREDGKETEAPWQCLAVACEMAEAMLFPEDFESCIPVGMDGSCNGLQHLSAMGLDPVGALATNLCAVDERHDVYLTVADECIRRVELDAAKGLPVALLWLGSVGRDTVKRSVLATPYGISDEGVRRGLVKDNKVPTNDSISARDSSAYFRDVLVESLSGTVVAAKQIMGWLQASAQKMGEVGVPFTWETPMGSTIQQAYRELEVVQIKSLVGQMRYLKEAPGGALDARKQALGSAPNVVHSFDAAHLAATVNTLGGQYGVEDFAMVHDSYGTHAADTTTMHAVLREEFVAMYREDHLERLAERFRRDAPMIDLPSPPVRGDFDLESNVPKSRFFFA